MIEHVRKTLVLLCSIYKSPSLYGWVSSCWVGALGALDVHVSTPSPRNLRHSSERVAIVERILGVNPQLIQSSHRFRLAQQGFELLQGDDDRRLSWCH